MSYYGDGRVSSDFCGLAREKRALDEPRVFQVAVGAVGIGDGDGGVVLRESELTGDGGFADIQIQRAAVIRCAAIDGDLAPGAGVAVERGQAEVSACFGAPVVAVDERGQADRVAETDRGEIDNDAA